MNGNGIVNSIKVATNQSVTIGWAAIHQPTNVAYPPGTICRIHRRAQIPCSVMWAVSKHRDFWTPPHASARNAHLHMVYSVAILAQAIVAQAILAETICPTSGHVVRNVGSSNECYLVAGRLLFSLSLAVVFFVATLLGRCHGEDVYCPLPECELLRAHPPRAEAA